MKVGDRVRVNGGAPMAGTLVWVGRHLATVLWDNGQQGGAWVYALVPA